MPESLPVELRDCDMISVWSLLLLEKGLLVTGTVTPLGGWMLLLPATSPRAGRLVSAGGPRCAMFSSWLLELDLKEMVCWKGLREESSLLLRPASGLVVLRQQKGEL